MSDPLRDPTEAFVGQDLDPPITADKEAGGRADLSPTILRLRGIDTPDQINMEQPEQISGQDHRPKTGESKRWTLPTTHNNDRKVNM